MSVPFVLPRFTPEQEAAAKNPSANETLTFPTRNLMSIAGHTILNFLPEKNMYPNAYMDFLSEPEFTFSAFWKALRILNKKVRWDIIRTTISISDICDILGMWVVWIARPKRDIGWLCSQTTPLFGRLFQIDPMMPQIFDTTLPIRSRRSN